MMWSIVILSLFSCVWLSEARVTCNHVNIHELEEKLKNATLDFGIVTQNLLNYTSVREPDRDWDWFQIGSNTMDPHLNMNDPMLKYLPEFKKWRKFFVEPIPPLYESLKENIKRFDNAVAINVAISPNDDDEEGIAIMYCPEREKANTWWGNQICSFNKNHIKLHFPDSDEIPVNVTSVSISYLLQKYPIYDVGFLLIDTEGYDYHVLKQIPFHSRLFRRPPLIVYEHKHLHEKEPLAIKYLNDNCYAVLSPFPGDIENSMAFDLDFLKSAKFF